MTITEQYVRGAMQARGETLVRTSERGKTTWTLEPSGTPVPPRIADKARMSPDVYERSSTPFKSVYALKEAA